MKTFKIIYSAILFLFFVTCLFMLHTTEINILNAYYAGNEDLISVYKDQKICLIYLTGVSLLLSSILYFDKTFKTV